MRRDQLCIVRSLRCMRRDQLCIVRNLRCMRRDQFCMMRSLCCMKRVLWFGRKPCGLTLRALAQRVGGLDYTSVGLGVKRFEQRLLVNKKLRHLTDQVDKALRL